MMGTANALCQPRKTAGVDPAPCAAITEVGGNGLGCCIVCIDGTFRECGSAESAQPERVGDDADAGQIHRRSGLYYPRNVTTARGEWEHAGEQRAGRWRLALISTVAVLVGAFAARGAPTAGRDLALLPEPTPVDSAQAAQTPETVETETPSDPRPRRRTSSRWMSMAPAPFSVGSPAPGVWDGADFVVWPGRGSAAAYDPQANRWASLPPAPEERAQGWSATWTGERILYWGGLPGGVEPAPAPASLLALDPSAAEWEVLPDAPIEGRMGHAAAWGDGRLWVWGGHRDTLGPSADGAVYDAATQRWERLPDAPLSGRVGATAIWTGAELLVWGGRDGRDAFAAADGARYDPATGEWRSMASLPVPYRGVPATVWSGERLLVFGRPGPGLQEPDNYAYEPESDRWVQLPTLLEQTRSGGKAVWTGERAAVWGGVDWRFEDLRTDGFSYDPATTAWSQIPPVGLRPRYEASVVWTGSSLLVWGGWQDGFARSDGALYPLGEVLAERAR